MIVFFFLFVLFAVYALFFACAVTHTFGIFDCYTHCKDSFVFFIYGTVKTIFLCLDLPR